MRKSRIKQQNILIVKLRNKQMMQKLQSKPGEVRYSFLEILKKEVKRRCTKPSRVPHGSITLFVIKINEELHLCDLEGTQLDFFIIDDVEDMEGLKRELTTTCKFYPLVVEYEILIEFVEKSHIQKVGIKLTKFFIDINQQIPPDLINFSKITQYTADIRYDDVLLTLKKQQISQLITSNIAPTTSMSGIPQDKITLDYIQENPFQSAQITDNKLANIKPNMIPRITDLSKKKVVGYISNKLVLEKRIHLLRRVNQEESISCPSHSSIQNNKKFLPVKLRKFDYKGQSRQNKQKPITIPIPCRQNKCFKKKNAVLRTLDNIVRPQVEQKAIHLGQGYESLNESGMQSQMSGELQGEIDISEVNSRDKSSYFTKLKESRKQKILNRIKLQKQQEENDQTKGSNGRIPNKRGSNNSHNKRDIVGKYKKKNSYQINEYQGNEEKENNLSLQLDRKVRGKHVLLVDEQRRKKKELFPNRNYFIVSDNEDVEDNYYAIIKEKLLNEHYQLIPNQLIFPLKTEDSFLVKVKYE